MSRHSMALTGLALLIAACGAAQAEPATHTIRVLTPETAQKAMNAALAACRKGGYQVAVAVVDRSGVTQAMVRDRFAGAHTPGVAEDKAWTAVSFRTNTTELAAATQPGQASSGLRNVPRFTAVGLGVSGAPSGEADDACAKAGLAAVQADLEL
jgi:uncharacterized protein GlcG (DUF336 family)